MIDKVKSKDRSSMRLDFISFQIGGNDTKFSLNPTKIQTTNVGQLQKIMLSLYKRLPSFNKPST